MHGSPVMISQKSSNIFWGSINMNSLYQINQDLLNLFQQVDDQEGELTTEQEELLIIKEGELQQRVSLAEGSP